MLRTASIPPPLSNRATFKANQRQRAISVGHILTVAVSLTFFAALAVGCSHKTHSSEPYPDTAVPGPDVDSSDTAVDPDSHDSDVLDPDTGTDEPQTDVPPETEPPDVPDSEPDGGEIAKPFGCVGEWPVQEPTTPIPSLKLPRFKVLGSDLYPIGVSSGVANYWSGRMGFDVNNRIVSYDVAARTFVTSAKASLDCFTVSIPAIRRNEPGGFAAGCRRVFGLRADFDPGTDETYEEVVWIRPLGKNMSPYNETT